MPRNERSPSREIRNNDTNSSPKRKTAAPARAPLRLVKPEKVTVVICGKERTYENEQHARAEVFGRLLMPIAEARTTPRERKPSGTRSI
jgi:hypothetical protein